MTSRLSRIRESFKGIDGLLVTDMTNVRYLTGFTGSSGFLLISRTKNIFLTDFRYKEQAGMEIKGWDIIIGKGEMTRTISRLSTGIGIKRLGFETSISYEFHNRLSRMKANLKPLREAVEKLRAVKDDEEIRLITTAAKRAEAAFREIRPYIRKGIRENKIAGMLEERLKKAGCNRIPFDIIVASGKNSALPHARPTDKKLEPGDLIVIDWGGEAGGYYSDMTRTLLLSGSSLAEKKKIYATVLEANKRAVSAISTGADARKIDNSARYVIKKAGYGEFFGHGTGHGVGLQVHELPHISWKSREIIRENMVFTIEPGIYVPGLGGVRIEDMVTAGRKKAVLLTHLSRELRII